MSESALDLMDPKQLRGRSAVVTGSTSGIGLAVAEGLAAAGCNVAQIGRAHV